MAGLPYAVASTSWSEGTARRESPPGDAFRTNTNSLEGSLRHLLSGLAKIMTDEGAETSARISGAFHRLSVKGMVGRLLSVRVQPRILRSIHVFKMLSTQKDTKHTGCLLGRVEKGVGNVLRFGRHDMALNHERIHSNLWHYVLHIFRCFI